MGLAQKKIRSKLSRDPNNTNWSQNTSRFGHKVLVSQGWQPGKTLGVPDSKYGGSHYTAASSSHVRVTVKDDNLGLGARTGRSDRDETFGLELLSGLLGRLNGKEEVVLKKEKAARRDVKLLSYHENKWGSSRFIFGGYLIGDEIQDALERVEQVKESTQKKETKKRKHAEEIVVETLTETVVAVSTDENDNDVEEKLEKRARKEEKRRRKEEKKLRKEAKQLRRQKRKEAAENSTVDSSTPSEQDVSQDAHERIVQSSVVSSTNSGTSTPLFTPRGRQAIRQRYIQQKEWL